MTKRELALDTFEFYKTNPAALEEGGCRYKTASGEKCAVGRWVDEEKLKNLGVSMEDLNRTKFLLNIESTLGLKNILKEEVLEIPITFWLKLQEYHDVNISLYKDNKNYMRRKEEEILKLAEE